VNYLPMPQQADRLRAVPLPAVLLAAGAAPGRYDKARWRTAQGLISVTGCKFFNWTRGTGGGGAIDLVIHLYGLDFKAALAWLSRHFPGYTPPSTASSTPPPHLKLPVPDLDRLSLVKHYLVAERKITPAVVSLLIKSGDLYADSHANAVFLLRAIRNTTVGAELRGTGRLPWRGMAHGSRKNLGYFSIRNTLFRGIILCESAIDAISCFHIHSRHWCISTAGARPRPAWLPAIIRHGLPVYCGFDADPTGDNMAAAMIQSYPAIQRLRPPLHDWNDALKAGT
jgi:hypothetical protein